MIEAALILGRSGWAQLRRLRAPPLTIRESYMVFVAVYCLVGSLVGGAILWGIERSHGTERPFVDCLFTVASTASCTGLITLDTSTLQTGSNVVILVAMLMYGNTLLLSTMPVCIRLRRARADFANDGTCGGFGYVDPRLLAGSRLRHDIPDRLARHDAGIDAEMDPHRYRKVNESEHCEERGEAQLRDVLDEGEGQHDHDPEGAQAQVPCQPRHRVCRGEHIDEGLKNVAQGDRVRDS
jgi:hypothetical protein